MKKPVSLAWCLAFAMSVSAAAGAQTPPARASQEPVLSPQTPQRLPSSDPAKETFDLRLMHPGEKRALGDLERVECLANGTVRVHVKAAGQSLVATARKLQAIVLQTFRGDKEFSLGCGNRRPPDRVFLTYRPPPEPAAGRSTTTPASGTSSSARSTPAARGTTPPARGTTAARGTTTPTPTVVGEAVALEFMPAGYTP